MHATRAFFCNETSPIHPLHLLYHLPCMFAAGGARVDFLFVAIMQLQEGTSKYKKAYEKSQQKGPRGICTSEKAGWKEVIAAVACFKVQ